MARFFHEDPRLGRLILSACCLLSLDVVACNAPSDERWKMLFLTPAGEEKIAYVSTSELYAGLGKPEITNGKSECSAKFPISEADPQQGTPSPLRCRKLDTSTVVFKGPQCSGAFVIVDAATGKVVGRAEAGHSYSDFLGISPNGQYIAYGVPGTLWWARSLYIHHLVTGRRAILHVPPKWRLMGWDDDVCIVRGAAPRN
jgi:hypothetical protein